MILYEVLWDNGECYEDSMTTSHIFTTLDKAKEYYNREHIASGYSYANETLTLSSFESDVDDQKRTEIEQRILSEPIPESYMEDEYEPDIDDFMEYDPNALY